jgi:predicted outer membrane protein
MAVLTVVQIATVSVAIGFSLSAAVGHERQALSITSPAGFDCKQPRQDWVNEHAETGSSRAALCLHGKA